LTEEEDKLSRLVSTLRRFGAYDELVAIVEGKYGVTLGEVLGDGRRAHVANARHEAMYLCWVRFRWSYPALGDLFGRDHTTVIAAVQKVRAQKAKEQTI
jgi:chromosomal replication initiator protein